ncbi:hypothetical protein TPY_2692 [Sulfobacillus acidophilus TPY]|uniref:Type II secretion system F domain protein n=1 Tax=Sulfobacillus acidophilus (strain ATCC 700253 / DSM 10332 / NAL) TaxID=679936 RepID=G8TUP0_SULAD|nr:hypothetical protein TPY_2692 [Sulfobacillus acidophilus TPY]AEW04687.1 Type II secretion system F domain protein [Sulfobacillus acidophilus DSM 10332]
MTALDLLGHISLLGGLAAAGWWAAPRPRPRSWWASQGDARYRQALQWLWQRLTAQATRQAAEVMGLNGPRLIGLLLGGGVFAFLWLVGLFRVAWPLALGIVGVGVLLIPNRWIARRYARWQTRLAAGLSGLANRLMILFDLGRPLLGALKQAAPQTPSPLKNELYRVIARLEEGWPVDQALQGMDARAHRMEVTTFATTLSLSTGRRLTSETLVPLTTMLASQHLQTQEQLTGSAEQVASTIPILAFFGLMIVGLTILLIQSFSGFGGLSGL